ncbi:type II toxin-antitoxin system HicA family toxin [Dyadobacter sp. CY343]|uniref:type II toxin-antitoxin system HicA family toxin n=1 Tax=Dyadobacter sp. CY343 TaxID=2907299 RepID=UPI001F1B153B|nr:type II toxin-antitoxin system HicA family toxin [Dyadobacter sp. CY343]MCE7061220.1 type II toxin-antitoxin system HicA family toxin [Dyadobacter sp. CY343]
MTSREVLKLLKHDGWVKKCQSGSHLQMIHPFKAGKVTVPMHSGDLKPGTLHSILKQAGL